MIPPLVYVIPSGPGVEVIAPRFRVRVGSDTELVDYHGASAITVLRRYHGASATFSISETANIDGALAEVIASLLVSAKRQRRIAAPNLLDPVVTDNGFAAATQSDREDPSRPLMIRFWGRDLRSRPPATGIPSDFNGNGFPPVRAANGVYLVEYRTGRAYWCRSGHPVAKLPTPGLVGLAPDAKRGLWWAGGRTVLALTQGTGAAIRPGRVLWSRPDARLPLASFLPGGAMVERPVDGPTDVPLRSVVSFSGRENRRNVPRDVGAISPDGTLWRIGAPPEPGAASPGPFRPRPTVQGPKVWIEKRVGGRWVRVPSTLPPNVLKARFVDSP